MSLIKEIKRDPTYTKAKKQLDNIKEALDTEAVLKELFSLHSSRGISALTTKSVLQSSKHILVDSSIQEIAVHSRVTTIKMTALRNMLTLEKLVDPLRKYILSRYGAEIRETGAKSIALQRDYIGSVLKYFNTEIVDLNYVIQICDLIHKDLDSASWGLKRIQETLTELSKER